MESGANVYVCDWNESVLAIISSCDAVYFS